MFGLRSLPPHALFVKMQIIYPSFPHDVNHGPLSQQAKLDSAITAVLCRSVKKTSSFRYQTERVYFFSSRT